MNINRSLVALSLLTASSAAHAYIDPNAGGMLFQILTPVLIALAAGWHWIRRGVVRVARSIWAWPTSRAEK